MKYTFFCVVALFALVACNNGNQPTDEELGAEMLSQAQRLLESGDTKAARDTILSLRKRYPRAIEARKKAIATLDSVDLVEAKAEGDTLKIEFYRRKLKIDSKQ